MMGFKTWKGSVVALGLLATAASAQERSVYVSDLALYSASDIAELQQLKAGGVTTLVVNREITDAAALQTLITLIRANATLAGFQYIITPAEPRACWDTPTRSCDDTYQLDAAAQSNLQAIIGVVKDNTDLFRGYYTFDEPAIHCAEWNIQRACVRPHPVRHEYQEHVRAFIRAEDPNAQARPVIVANTIWKMCSADQEAYLSRCAQDVVFIDEYLREEILPPEKTNAFTFTSMKDAVDKWKASPVFRAPVNSTPACEQAPAVTFVLPAFQRKICGDPLLTAFSDVVEEALTAAAFTPVRRGWSYFAHIGEAQQCQPDFGQGLSTCPSDRQSVINHIAPYPSQELRSAAMIDWGYEGRRWWVDVNNDGLQDFCRGVGGTDPAVGGLVSCTLATHTGFGNTFWSQAEVNWSLGSFWADINADQLMDFCALEGVSPTMGKLHCLTSSGNGFGTQLIHSPVLALGDADSRVLLDVNGDNQADFCRRVGPPGNGQVVCDLRTSTTFSSQTVLFASAGTGGFWGRINDDPRPDYCEIETGSQLVCRLSSTAAGLLFAAPVSTHLDVGHPGTRVLVDFDADHRADFCRAVGDGPSHPNGRESFVRCTSAQLTGGALTWGATRTSFETDWGRDGQWVDFNRDGKTDYCRVVGATNFVDSRVVCTAATGVGSGSFSCDGTHAPATEGEGFGASLFSQPLDWGHVSGRSFSSTPAGLRYCRVVGDLTPTADTRRLACALMTPGP